MSNFERYTLLMHKMQGGVGIHQQTDPRYEFLTAPGTPPGLRHLFKQERTGINGARVEIGALTALLIEKGVFTEDEWWTMACKLMQQEIDNYEKWLSERLGVAVTLDSPYIDPVTGTRRV